MKPNHMLWQIASVLTFALVAAWAFDVFSESDGSAQVTAEVMASKEHATFETIEFTLVGAVHPVLEADLVAIEHKLNCRFPPAYRDFVQKYGWGDFSGLCLRVFSPWHILASTKSDQQRLKEFWFWPGSARILPQKDGVRSVACFDTSIGHDIRFLPEDASTMFVLSRDEDRITPCRDFAEIVRLLDSDWDSRFYEFLPRFHPHLQAPKSR